MRIDRDRLVFKALVALDEAVSECSGGPVKPSFALRFALAYLHAAGDGDRRCFDDFWKVIRDPYEWAYSDTRRSYLRPTNARTHLHGIVRSVGLELTVDLERRLGHARKPKAERQAIEAKEAEMARIREALAGGAKRREAPAPGRECRLGD